MKIIYTVIVGLLVTSSLAKAQNPDSLIKKKEIDTKKTRLRISQDVLTDSLSFKLKEQFAREVSTLRNALRFQSETPNKSRWRIIGYDTVSCFPSDNRRSKQNP